MSDKLNKITCIVEVLMILALGAVAIGLVIKAGESYDREIDKEISEHVNLKLIIGNNSKEIYYDKNTGVMYMYFNGGITPVYNADGTLKLYEEEK